MELKFKEGKKNYYILKVCGVIKNPNYNNRYETIVKEMPDKDWCDVDLLFFSYIAKGASGTCFDSRNYEKNDKSGAHYGRNFKNGPIGPYIGWWCQDIDDYISINWDDIHSVKIQHVNEFGVVEDVELPDVDAVFPTEKDFMDAFIEASDKRAKELGHNEGDEGIYLRPWDLPLVRKILIANGWDERRVNNIFYINNDTCFAELDDNETPTLAGKEALEAIRSMKKATDNNGRAYTGFKPETFANITTAVNNSELPEITKQVVLSALKVYCNLHIPDEWTVNSLTRDLIELNKYKGINTRPCGKVGYSGMFIAKISENTDIDLDDYDEDSILKYEGDTYIISESD